MIIKVAACQVPDIRENIEASFQWIEKFARQAMRENVSLVCFPECFLQGYLTEEHLARKHAISLHSPVFKNIFERLAAFTSVIVFGMIEEEKDHRLYNTAVVIKNGQLIGKYRKVNLLKGEQLFSPGNDFPVFEIDGLRFGINICYDTQFPGATANLARQGARLILCPSNNMMRYETAQKYKHLHHEMRIQRTTENKIWLLSADVTGEREGRIAYGPTSIIDPSGNVVAQVPLMETGMVSVEIQ